MSDHGNPKKYPEVHMNIHGSITMGSLKEINLLRIQNGKAPIVNEKFLEYFPQYADYLDQPLIHHHIGGGGQAMPIPQDLHSGGGGVHNVEKQLGIWGGVDDSVFSELLQSIKSMTIRTKKWKNVRIK